MNPKQDKWKNTVAVPKSCGLKDGEKFTAKGWAWMPDGRLTNRCKPGDETEFVAYVEEAH